jgi:FAD:protein FMN transferase
MSQPGPENRATFPAILPDVWLTHVTRRAMATAFEVLLPHDSPPDQTELAMRSLDEVERIERELSVYIPQSVISRLNRAAGSGWIQVGSDVIEVLKVAKEVHALTQGGFDVTAGPLVKAWGFMEREGRKPSAEEISDALSLVGSQYLEIDESRRTAQLLQANMQVNLGGIGKGYAIDKAAWVLRAGGTRSFLMHGGQSSAIARGVQHPELPGWAVALNHPTRQSIRLGRVFLNDQALATSGSGRQFFHINGKRMGHVIDPRTGWPAGDLLSLTLVAPTAMFADALATGMFVLGREAAFRLAADLPEISLLAVSAADRQGEVLVETLRCEEIWQPEP